MRLFPSPEETIAGLAPQLRAGRISCLELVERCLARIDQWEGEIRAWVLIDRDGARGRARELDDDLQAGRWHGPLHGIPVGIKDIIDVAGWPTRAASAWLAQGIAERDAPVVEALRAGGAVILGKTVTTQFAAFDPPPTRNPWNASHTPGGSSSGSAAAVATGMCLGALGSQTGGSITRPAAYCGVAGFKPTYGRLSVEGILPLAPSLDHPGPIARCVGDLELLFDALAGAKVEGRSSKLESKEMPRLGRVRGMFDERAERAALEVLERGLGWLRDAGAYIGDIALPAGFDEVLPNHRVVMAAEAAACHESWFASHADDYQPRIRSLVEEGLAIRATDYLRCRRHQTRLQQEMPAVFNGLDALVCLAAPGPAPDPSTTGDPAFNSPWSYTGLPTVSFPIGLAPDGLPLGLQIIGPAHGEGELFRVAAWCEEVIRERASRT